MSGPRFELAVVVLGMHRSGSSALTGMLGKCGLAMPRNLIPPGSANERGFWESEVVNTLNDQVMTKLGMNWYSLDAISPQLLGEPSFAAERQQAERILCEEFVSGSIPVIKDPRLCRVLPLWEPALTKLAGRTVFPIILRNPLEVAQSLAHRNAFDPELGIALWVRYYLDAELATRGRRRCFTSYANLLDDWQTTVVSLTAALDLPLDPAAVRSAGAEHYVSTELRHHRNSDTDLLPEFKRLPVLVDAWQILIGWAKGKPETSGDYDRLDAAREQLDKTGALMASLLERSRVERKRRVTARAETDKAVAKLAQAERTLHDLADLKQTLVDASERASARQDERFDELRRQYSDDRQAFEAHFAVISEALTSQRRDAQAELREMAARVTEAESEIDVRNDEIAVLRSEMAGRAAEAESEIDVRGTEIARLRTEMDQVKRKYRSTQAILERERERNKKGQLKLSAAVAEGDRLRHSVALRTQERIQGLSRQLTDVLSFGAGRRRQRREQLELLRTSELFDPAWYLQKYPDVAEAGINPAEHFLSLGWREGRSPSAAFSSPRYLKTHADVAALGTNPLLHYLEHGQFEGRDIQGASPIAPTSMVNSEPMGPAAPCAKFDLPAEPNARWIRAWSLPNDDPQSVVVDQLSVGRGGESCSRAASDDAIADFVALSGFGDKAPLSAERNAVGVVPDLTDAWFAGKYRIRSRWAVEQPTVIRGIQFDGAGKGRAILVGEGLAATGLDLVDLDLANPLFPLLMVATTPAGDILGLKVIAFPSLLRGGLHYSEMIDLAGSDVPAAMAIAGPLEQGLRAILDKSAKPLVKTIAVDLAGGDGAGPLFQSDMRAWLSRVVRIAVVAHGSVDDPGAEFLAEMVALAALERGRASGGTLTLAADMVPAISVLVAHSASSGVSRESAMAFITNELDSSQPATRFDPPLSKAMLSSPGSRHYPPAFPRLKGKSARPALAALRTTRRSLSESELLVPDMAWRCDHAPLEAMTWVIAVDHVDVAAMNETLGALALQDGKEGFHLSLAGKADPETTGFARELFGDRVTVHGDVDAALAAIETSLVGYIGGGVVLHDARTARVLQALLDDDAIVSASCVLVSAERRGKGWKIATYDGGVIPIDGVDVRGDLSGHEAQMLWRSTFAVIQPPRDLWIARREAVIRWHSGQADAKGMHLVTAVVAASASNPPHDEVPVLAPLPVGPTWAVRGRSLVG